MTGRHKRLLLRATALSGAVLATLLSAPRAAFADADADAKISRLLDLLVKKNIVSPKQAHELFRETEGTSTPRGRERSALPGGAPAKPGDIRVTYVPQFIRKQIADQVRAQVMSEAQTEGWAVPSVLPEWTQRFRPYGDLRVRYERDSFDRRNYNNFINFQSVNQGAGLNVQGSIFPFLNTNTNRDRERVRARLGFQAQVDSWLTADFRLSTGADQGPVTPNQTQGQPGDFAKYSAYIDRAYFTAKPIPGLEILAGRFPNPFDTTDLIFYSELNFDGVAASYSHNITANSSAYITGGVLPILNTAFDFSTNAVNKSPSTNAYLFALQGGGQWQIKHDVLAKLGIGYFNFNGVQGAVSSPCSPLADNATYVCDTDATRFPFQQFGNTVYAIRDIVPNGVPSSQTNPQYFGLASRFSVFEAHPRVVVSTYDPLDIVVDGEYLKNLAYDRAAILAHGPSNASIGINLVGPQNNLGTSPKGVLARGPYQGGDTGYIIRAQVGALQIHKLWDWNVMGAYKYVETDATLDSITDADFHLGGTNAKGYILTGSLGIAHNTFLSLRYFDATVISGPPDTNQVFQLDLQASF